MFKLNLNARGAVVPNYVQTWVTRKCFRGCALNMPDSGALEPGFCSRFQKFRLRYSVSVGRLAFVSLLLTMHIPS